MRIIGGKYKRRLLKVLSKDISPTKDFVRETLFNILMPDIPEASVLDLYAGSGSFGIEALSRGAGKIYMVDKDISSLKENIKILDTNDGLKAEILRQEAADFITAAAKKSLKFNLIFLDPPYHKGLIKKSLHLVMDYDILQPDGLIIAEYEKRAELDIESLGLKEIRQVRAGKTIVSLLKRKTS
jgi:16S rRNA (guanine(966)-N(2))-methyltransferase RsmD